jgi:TonB family protein
LQEHIDLVVVAEEKRKAGGLSLSVIVSLIAHTALIVWFITSYKPMPAAREVPMARYVELMQQQPKEFTEAPGPEVATAPLNAPLSDKNRKASMPEPTGPNPTTRPGDGTNEPYTPPLGSPAPREAQAATGAPPTPAPRQSAPAQNAPPPTDTSSFIYREPVRANAAAGPIDWRGAADQVARTIVGRPGGVGGPGDDLANVGGEQGTAEQGPLSFESQWYDWGDYAASMVSKIRVNWYANMPQIIRSGMKGVVTIRFTIHRDGRISDITVLNSSTVPPYDAAARKAIELSSPLKPLPADFPSATERVTCMFYYNMEIPRA